MAVRFIISILFNRARSYEVYAEIHKVLDDHVAGGEGSGYGELLYLFHCCHLQLLGNGCGGSDRYKRNACALGLNRRGENANGMNEFVLCVLLAAGALEAFAACDLALGGVARNLNDTALGAGDTNNILGYHNSFSFLKLLRS